MPASQTKEIAAKELVDFVDCLVTSIQNRLAIEREVIPLIFIPGIMGSRLGRTQQDKVWDPDNSWFMLTTYGRRKTDAELKKALLIGDSFVPTHLQVLNHDTEHNAIFFEESDTSRSKRGWGGVSWNSYGDILKALQCRQWDQTVNLFYEFPVHAFGYNWTASNDDAGLALAQYIEKTIASYKDGTITPSGEPRGCNKVILVTHSMGGLVARSACLLHGAKDKVLGIIHGVQPANGSPAAYWRMKGGFERPHSIPDIDFFQWFRNPVKMFRHTKGKIISSKIIGIPFTNLKVGQGHVTSWVLGTDGEEVTALLGNMPGGLQLLPNKQYKNNDGWERWLELVDSDGNRTALPESDPYQEIYRKKGVYYRLVNPEWLNPGKSEEIESFESGDWKHYLKYLGEAETFHDSIAAVDERCHPETYQFYSSGIASPDRVVFTREEDSMWATIKRIATTMLKDAPEDLKEAAQTIVFKAIMGGGNPLVPVLIDTAKSLAGGAVVKNTSWYANRGGYRDRINDEDLPSEDGNVQLVVMQMPDGAGDGTVPESSGSALKPSADCKRTFCIADRSGFEAKAVEKNAKRTKPKHQPDFDEGFFDRGHEPIFKTKSAQFITITAIENICRREIQKMLSNKG